ncbi:hypothetical protein HMI54_013144 [Coelomomyces lativittatus]|nr:hypothetical protein HMI54_013144 [Coelomomyces lativittatus]
MASTAGLENIPDSLFVTGNSPTNVHTQSADYSPPAIHNPNNNQNAYSPPNNNQNAYNPPNTNSCCNNAPPAQPYGNSDTFSTTSTEDADDADDIFKGSSSGNTLQFTKYTVSGILVLSMIMFI